MSYWESTERNLNTLLQAVPGCKITDSANLINYAIKIFKRVQNDFRFKACLHHGQKNEMIIIKISF